MARARDFNGSANETVVVSPKDVKGKVKDSILGKKARLWLLTINNPQNHGISLEQQEILERLKEDIASGAVTYVSSVMEQSLTTDENGKHTPHGHIAVYYPPQTHGGHLQKIFPMAALQNCNASIDDLCNCGKGYVSSAFTSYLTNFRRYLDIDDVGTDYVLNPTSGDWEQRYLLPPHVEPKKENDHDESEQQ